MGLGHPPYDAFQAQPAQVIGQLTRRVVVSIHSQQVSHQRTQGTMCQAVGCVHKRGERGEQGHAPGLAKAQPRRSLAVRGDGGLHYPLDVLLRQVTSVTDPLDVQETSVDVTTNLL